MDSDKSDKANPAVRPMGRRKSGTHSFGGGGSKADESKRRYSQMKAVELKKLLEGRGHFIGR